MSRKPRAPVAREPVHSRIRNHLLAWYDRNRRELPWRPPAATTPKVREAATEPTTEPTGTPDAAGPDPYRVWIAEVMLVQTRVETVIPYYHRFLDRFPDLTALATAELDDVLKLWEGLGYYARARNLHRAARIVLRDHGGRLPRDAEELLALPGIGPYMTAAIRSIAFGEPELAIDGNVRRVVSRLFDLPKPDRAAVLAAAAPLTEERPGDVNQALMDLGARICTPRRPRCAECPVEEICQARARDTVHLRPGRRPRRKRPHYDVAVGVIWDGGRLLIAKRHPEGLLGGLWEFPGGKPEPGERLEDTVAREVAEEVGIEVEIGDRIASIDHAYSHFEITLHAYHCRYLGGTPEPLGCADLAWVAPDRLDDYAFPAANRRILERLTEGAPGNRHTGNERSARTRRGRA